MNRAYDNLRSGAWLTRERARLVAGAILGVSGLALAYLVVTAHGLVDTQGRPLGTDFSSFYAAGTHVLDGHPDAPYDIARQHARQQAIFGPTTPFYGWLYPPFFLFIAAALARLPYSAALAVWQAVTLGLYLLAIRAILTSSLRGAPTGPARSGRPDDRLGANPQSKTAKFEESAWKTGLWWRWFWTADSRSAASAMARGWLVVALAFPAVLINLGHGQNGFLTAALLGGALAVLDRRPIVAGLLLGLLAYKPQFGLLIPLVLAAGGHWRSFAAAATTVALLALATTLTFGTDVWHAFLESSRFARLVVLEQGDPGFHKMQSVFAWARMWGAPIPVAYALQAALAAGLAAALVWLWRSAAPYQLKAAALCLGTILATPFTFDYDMVLLAPAIAFLTADGLARGFGPWEKTALAALWLMPLLARSVAQITLIPIGVPVMLALFILLLRRSTSNFTSPMAFSGTFLLK
jgi:alpha-1,2-mannosyltransferase